MTKQEKEIIYKIANLSIELLDYKISSKEFEEKATEALRSVKNCNLPIVTVSLPSREDYDNRQLKPMYFTKDTSVGNSVLYIKGDEYDPYNWNYSRLIDYFKEGRLGYAR